MYHVFLILSLYNCMLILHFCHFYALGHYLGWAGRVAKLYNHEIDSTTNSATGASFSHLNINVLQIKSETHLKHIKKITLLPGCNLLM